MDLDNQRNIVATWLELMRRDRYWLAEVLGTQKSTVDSWFSKRPFPRPAWKRITELMDETTGYSDAAILKVTFTLEEFELLERARTAAGYESRVEYYRDAILAYTSQLAQKQQQPYRPNPDPTSFILNDSDT